LWYGGWRILKGLGYSKFKTLFAISFSTVGSISGARLLSILSEPLFYENFSLKLFETMMFKTGGLSFLGAFTGGAIFLTISIFILKEKILLVFDLFLPIVFIALGIGRFGCLSAGCCYGKPTSFPLSIVFEDFDSRARPIGVPVHPTQIYEMLSAFLCATMLYFFRKKNKTNTGSTTSLGLIIYPSFRIFLDNLRGGTRLFFIGISFMQWFCIFLIIFGFILLLISNLRKGVPLRKIHILFFSPCVLIFPAIFHHENIHFSSFQGKCISNSDCIYNDSCIDSKCKYIYSLDVEIRFENMFGRNFKGDLIVEASRCKQSLKGREICNGKILKKVINSKKFPVNVSFERIPHGKYLVVCGVDINKNGKIDEKDLGGISIIKVLKKDEKEDKIEKGVVTVQYPYSFFKNRVDKMRRRTSFWDPIL
jgi:phosphatidylglycerol:prolipoprotein diacylglycerol transferase